MKELTAAAIILWTAAPAAAARIEDRTLELYEAAKAGDYPAVKEILDDSDQNVNVAYDDNNTSPLMLACLAGEEKMARLLIERGAEIAAVDAAGRPVEEYLLPADSPAQKRLLRLIYAVADMKNIRLPYAWHDLFMPDPSSSPSLSRDPQVLPAANAADGDEKTAWASKGTGAVLWLFINSGAPSLRLVNGYGKSSRLFAANNRVSKLLVSVWTAEHFEGDVTEKIRLWKAARITPDLRLELKDTRDPQEFDFPFNWEELRFKKAEAASALMKRADYRERERLYSSFVLRVEPAEVYRGSRYDDTCVSEISAGDPWLNEAALPGRWERPYGKTAEVLALSPPPERAYSLKRGETPLSSGRWRAEDGDLVLEHGDGAERYSAAAENRRGRRTLRLAGADGTTLIYRAAR